jgi:2-keto-4-pentenoate hydratase/2-oxohepta-3-ene-1,7-dioic acid hydratase in catechol pathway
LSKKIILKPGDILFTGTPAGVGKINRGDFLEACIEEIGKLELNFN